MHPKLQSLTIKNFRSIRGEAVIPLDAQVVLIHGSNGMGKTSILSALELGLTGRIAHLADDGDSYQKYLTNFGSDGGTIGLKLSSPLPDYSKDYGSVEFTDNSFSAKPLLTAQHSRFFSERCFLPQSALGQLLEIYDDQTTSTNSPLTLFVKELLGLDPLDSLVDGLNPALHLTRLKNLAPEFRRSEDLKNSLSKQLAEVRKNRETRQKEQDVSGEKLQEDFELLDPNWPAKVPSKGGRKEIRFSLERGLGDNTELQRTHRLRSELNSAVENLRTLPQLGDTEVISKLKNQAARASKAYGEWSNIFGLDLDGIIEQMSSTFQELIFSDQGPERARSQAAERASSEVLRCDSLIQKSVNAETEHVRLNSIIDRTARKIQELDKNISVGASDVQTLAKSLAGVTPHISEDFCPVCDRDFSEMGKESLSAHVASKIGALTTEAGRLQAVAEECAVESKTLSNARQAMLSIEQIRLDPEALGLLRGQTSKMKEHLENLNSLQAEAEEGEKLSEQASTARAQLRQATKNQERSSAWIAEISQLVMDTTGKEITEFNGLESAIDAGQTLIASEVSKIEKSNSLRIACLQKLEIYEALGFEIEMLKTEGDELAGRISQIEAAAAEVSRIRADAKSVSSAATAVRSSIVKRVFSESLNTLWRDLFLRLAPSEQFVPSFKLPTDDKGNVEAVLETLHRTGIVSGSPGAMLSQGNLNTAALTLFLALHLSVPLKQPWLVLDDPVQSMDDVHITQMAALLRTISKGMNRQIIVAVHERALFDYLTLELSPAFSGDSLISVEISKNFSGDTVVSPVSYSYEKDSAIAA